MNKIRSRTRPIGNLEILRQITATFDENVMALSSGPDIGSAEFSDESLKTKQRLFEFLTKVTGATMSVTAFDPYELIEQENAQLRMENYLLAQRMQRIEKRLATVEATTPKEGVIVLREINRDEAKEEIAQLFLQGETLYYSDIAARLRLDLELVVDICEELLQEDKITVAEDLQ